MKIKHFLLAAGLLVALFTTSCSSGSDKEAAWQHERDSLINAGGEQSKLLANLTSTMAELSDGLDSITTQERDVLGRTAEGNSPTNRKTLKAKLGALANIIKEQKEKMAAMEKALADGSPAIKHLRTIIAGLRQSLEQKDKEIAQLRAELDNSNFNVARLNTLVSNLGDTISKAKQQSQQQNQRIEQLGEEANKVYYIIGTKAQLQTAKAIDGGFLKKKKVNFATVNKDMLTSADRRTLQTIHITGRSPKIMSPVPEGSYNLKGSTLTITDPERFWSINNRILVIMVK